MNHKTFMALALTLTVLLSQSCATQQKSAFTTKREIMTQLLDGNTFKNYVPTVFFMHFPAGTGRDAVFYHVRHLNRTGVDLLRLGRSIRLARPLCWLSRRDSEHPERRGW